MSQHRHAPQDTNTVAARHGPLHNARYELVADAVARVAATDAALVDLKEQMKTARKRHKAASDELFLAVQMADRAERGAAE